MCRSTAHTILTTHECPALLVSAAEGEHQSRAIRQTTEKETRQLGLEDPLFPEMLRYHRVRPTSPPNEEDSVDHLEQRLIQLKTEMHRQESEAWADETREGPFIVNHFDLQQDPPRRILKPKTANELKQEEFQASKEVKCPCDPSTSYTEQTEGTRFAYLITVHNYRTAEDATYLYRAIRDTGHAGAAPIILVHIDKKFAWVEYEQTSLYHELELKKCTCSTLMHVESIYDCKWGEWSMNDPTHWAMRVLTTDERFRGKWVSALLLFAFV